MSGEDVQIQNLKNQIAKTKDGEISFGKTRDQMRELLSEALTRRAQKATREPNWYDLLNPQDGQVVTVKGRGDGIIKWVSGHARILVDGNLTSPSAVGKTRWLLDGEPMKPLCDAAWTRIKEKSEES